MNTDDLCARCLTDKLMEEVGLPEGKSYGDMKRNIQKTLNALEDLNFIRIIRK